MTKRNICLLANSRAGQGKALQALKQAERALKNLPVNFRTIITSDIAEAQREAQVAAAQGEYIVAVGGDGTANQIAAVLKNRNGVLGFIPAGRGNDFTRMLNYPLNPASACEILAYGKEVTIDMGMVNQNPFLTICSLGFDSIVNRIANQTRLIRGPAVYLYAALRALLTWRPTTFIVTIDGNKFQHTGFTVAVANSSCYGGGLYLSPQSCVQDGLLEVILLGDVKKHRVIANIPRLLKGNRIDEPGFKILTGRHIQVEAENLYQACADGDILASSCIDITVIPKSLRVLVPASFTNDAGS